MAKATAEFGATLLMAVDAFIEQRGRTERCAEDEPLTELGNESLASVIHAA